MHIKKTQKETKFTHDLPLNDDVNISYAIHHYCRDFPGYFRIRFKVPKNRK